MTTSHLSSCPICLKAVVIADRCPEGIREAASSYRRMALHDTEDARLYRSQAAALELKAARKERAAA